jgi:transitional endoplasmic reticulum ATPase
MGRATFDAAVSSHGFRAPETLIGHYSVRTDIFALGIVLAFILQGKHPWDKCLKNVTQMPIATVIKQMSNNTPILTMEDELRYIVAKAIQTKPSERYKSLEHFGADIAKYLGNENLNSFECFAPAHSKSVTTPAERQNDEEGSAYFMKQQEPPQPKANVKIERVKGNGFKDVAGMKQLKSKLIRDFVDIVQNRELAAQFHITPPNGILLWGPPGTGKTFISRKLAEQTGMLYTLIKPSDLGNIYIHGSQSMIADLFTRSEELAAKNNCGVLLVFDEFDSLVPKRGVNDDNKQANEVAEFLTRLNDCAEKNIFVVATTNRIEAIETALLRKGRLDRIIYVGLPDEEARKELLEIELLKRPHEEIDITQIVELTKGYSSSDISFIVKECARCSFEESIKTKQLVKINQPLLEKIITNTRPSVTADELRQYERTEEACSKGRKAELPRIGF